MEGRLNSNPKSYSGYLNITLQTSHHIARHRRAICIGFPSVMKKLSCNAHFSKKRLASSFQETSRIKNNATQDYNFMHSLLHAMDAHFKYIEK